jgi:hypothetical protein
MWLIIFSDTYVTRFYYHWYKNGGDGDGGRGESDDNSNYY